MTVEELNELVPEDQREALGELIETIKADATTPDPLDKITDEGFAELLKGNVDLQKIIDARMSTGIETWQKNNLDKMYQERYAKEHPDETDEQKRIKALEISNDESKRRADLAELRSNAITALTTAKVDNAAELAGLLFENGKEPMDKVKFLSDHITALVESTVKTTTEKILKENGRVIDDHDRDEGKYYTPDQLENMSNRELEENQDKVLASMTYNQTHQ